jgi:hypothetical protein
VRCLLVSHNAGGAAVLAAWAAQQSGHYYFDCLLSGPAVTIFCQRLCHAQFIAQHAVQLRQYDCIITSTSSDETGWETRWIARARQQGVKSISVLDHWTNYLSRFLLRNEYVFPDELWVCDAYALAMAQCYQQELNTYPHAVQIPNYYLQDSVAYIHARRRADAVEGNILFVSEPSNNALYSAQEAFEAFLAYLASLDINNKNVRLRLHPREQLDDYAAVCERWRVQISIELSPNSRLEDDLCWAYWVVGCQTMAMVVAEAAGIKVASCLPASVEKSALPHKEIARLFLPS